MFPNKIIMEEKWRNIAIHDENNVKGFFAEYRFLSNFHKCKISFRVEPNSIPAKCKTLEE